MNNIITTKEFHGTNILFERKDAKTVNVKWQIFSNGIEYRYVIGTMDFDYDTTDKQVDVYSSGFMVSMDFYDAIYRVCYKLRNSNDIIERKFLEDFSKKYMESKVQ